MKRTIIPDNYTKYFPSDWKTCLETFLADNCNFRESPLMLQNVRQFIKIGLESEFLFQINSGLTPENVISTTRLSEIYEFLFKYNVWPIYGLGCNHCIESLDPIAPFVPASVIEGADEVAKNYPTIVSELSVIRRRIHTDTKEFIYTGTWRSINLWDSASLQSSPATHLFPKTMELLMNIPLFRDMHRLTSNGESFKSFIVRISLLKPGSVILPHFGLTNTRLRLQIPLEISSGDVFIYAHDMKRNWVIGEPLILNDSYIHGVYNNTNSDRVVLLIDLPHPDASLDQINSF